MKIITRLISDYSNLITGRYQVKTAKLRVINNKNSDVTKKQTKQKQINMLCCTDYMQYYTVYGIAHISITEYRTVLFAMS